MPAIVQAPFSDYIPGPDDELDAWAINFDTVGAASLNAYTIAAPIGWGAPGGVLVLINAFSTALALATNPSTRTSVSVAAKDTARDVMVVDLRVMAGYLMEGHKAGTLTDMEITDLGLRVPKLRSPILAPIFAPSVSAFRILVGSTWFTARDPATPDLLAKPYGVQLIECEQSFAGIVDNNTVHSRANFGLFAQPSRVGQASSIRCRYLTARGLASPWSSAVSFTVV